MNSIAQNIDLLRKEIPSDVRLVAVSKFHSVEEIEEAHRAGQYDFGENRAQEFLNKRGDLPADIRWHFIGSLQRNKVKQIVPYVWMIQSVDSERLMLEIEKESERLNIVTRVLFQIHLADEETKSGFSPLEFEEFLKNGSWRNCSHLSFCGLMTIATFTSDEEKVRHEFRTLKDIFDTTKELYFKSSDEFCERSMGMSHDYRIAIEEGSTMVRIGTSIFGARK